MFLICKYLMFFGFTWEKIWLQEMMRDWRVPLPFPPQIVKFDSCFWILRKEKKGIKVNMYLNLQESQLQSQNYKYNNFQNALSKSLSTMCTLAGQFSNCHDRILRLSAFLDLFGKVSFIILKFSLLDFQWFQAKAM